MWLSRKIAIPAKSRGFHLITRDVLQAVPEVSKLEVGLLHVFIQHTSASLTLNENADPDVRHDFETYFNQIAPEDGLPLQHTLEGPDDMPAHIKSSLLGSSVSIPIAEGQLQTGTWQGIYLFEHRTRPHQRQVAAHFQADIR